MSDVQIFPLLKAFDWNAKDVALCSGYAGIDKEPVPVIAFCYDHEDSYQIITQETAEANGWPAEALMQLAQNSIDAYPAEWESVEDVFLTSSGQDFSAEKMLCKEFLLEAHEKLDAEEILVSAPRRSVLYATRADLDDEKQGQFNTIVAHTLADDSLGNQFISPLIFRYTQGELTGAMVLEYTSE